jgi:hypothetical protein
LVKLALKHTGDPIPQLPLKLKDFQPLLEKMLAKNPHERVRNAEGLIRLIDALDFKVKEKTTKIPQVQPQRRKKTPLLVALLVVVLIAASGFLIMESKRRQDAAAWRVARSKNTAASYQDYLKEYPGGNYHSQAREAIAEIRKDLLYRREVSQAKIYFSRGSYEKALKKVVEAKKVKLTAEIVSLEQEIKRAMAGQ